MTTESTPGGLGSTEGLGPMPEPFGWVHDGLPSGELAFQKQAPDGFAALVLSTMHVYSYAQLRAAVAVKDARIEELEAADEGARVAYGHLSAQKRAAERECTHLRGLLDDAHAQIRRQAELLKGSDF